MLFKFFVFCEDDKYKHLEKIFIYNTIIKIIDSMT